MDRQRLEGNPRDDRSHHAITTFVSARTDDQSRDIDSSFLFYQVKNDQHVRTNDSWGALRLVRESKAIYSCWFAFTNTILQGRQVCTFYKPTQLLFYMKLVVQISQRIRRWAGPRSSTFWLLIRVASLLTFGNHTFCYGTIDEPTPV